MTELEMETAYKPPPWYKRLKAWYKRKTYRWKKEDSNLYKHALYELKLAFGEDFAEDFYGGMLPKAVLELVEVFARQGHSGMSASMARQIFNIVVDFKPLEPLTNSPDEWNQVGTAEGPRGKDVWQCRRQSSAFSNDGGLTYYVLDDKDSAGNYHIHTAKDVRV